MENNESNFKGILPMGVEVKEVMITPEMAKKILAKGMSCAWKDCKASYKGFNPPENWRNIVIFRQGGSDVDGMLCPNHIKELSSLIKKTRRDTEHNICAWDGCDIDPEQSILERKGGRILTVFKFNAGINPYTDIGGWLDWVTKGDIFEGLCPNHVKELGKYLSKGYHLDLVVTEETRSSN